MNRQSIIFMVVVLQVASSLKIEAGPYDNTIWQAQVTTNLPQNPEVEEMILVLQREVNSILDSGHLAPLRFFMTDTTYQSYWLYFEPGRIVTTLAFAYPFLTPEQQGKVRTYVNQELSDPATTVWSAQDHIEVMNGKRREPYSLSQDWGFSWFWGMDGQKRPRIQTLYGLWLYAFHSGDWQIVHNHWTELKDFYNRVSNQGNIYGTMSAHLAMARMAYQENDTSTMNQAVSQAEAALGLSFSTVEANKEALYSLPGYNYGGGSGRSTIYTGFQFLNLVPEVGRFLKDSSVKNEVLTMHSEGKKLFPFWWVRRAPYFTVWAGEEGVGAPPELIGMMFPVERFVQEASKDTLYGYYIWTAANGIGDCYVLEALVHTITAFGTPNWVDVRTPGEASKILITALPSQLPPDGTSTSNITATIVDENNIPVTGSTATVEFVLSGTAGGTLLGPTSVNAQGGVAAIVYRTGSQEGLATVTVSSSPLTPGNVTITVATVDNSRPIAPANLKVILVK